MQKDLANQDAEENSPFDRNLSKQDSETNLRFKKQYSSPDSPNTMGGFLSGRGKLISKSNKKTDLKSNENSTGLDQKLLELFRKHQKEKNGHQYIDLNKVKDSIWSVDSLLNNAVNAEDMAKWAEI